MSNLYKEQFLKASKDWVCDSCSIDIRYVARKDGDIRHLMAASIGVSPLPLTDDLGFCLETSEICAGQLQLSGQDKQELLEIIEQAAQGILKANGLLLELFCDREYSYHSELSYGDRWFSELTLQIIGGRGTALPVSHIDACKIDDALRQCSPPFDGMADLTGWLGLKNSLQTHDSPTINISVLPPVDLDFHASSLEKDVLNLKLYAHPNFDLDRLVVAIRIVPGVGVKSRKQVSSEINWKSARKGVREGQARIRLNKADSVLTMFVIGNITVRRQWFLDPTKSGNNRLVSVQLFDKELKMIRNALFESADSTRFEMGVAALFFLMGFASLVQLENDSPDVVVATPGGRLILIECTTRIADFSSKLGKLVDRKRMLSKALEDGKSPNRVDGILVCALPKDQIAIRIDELQNHQVILMARNDLTSALDQVRFHIDPDKFVEDSIAKMNSNGFLLRQSM
ncbi:MAG TPA: hypothetical protein PLU16_01820 [Gallionellaceae bacterium]|nr:MAG: hypothetical protein B7Y04_13540 [Gallionellales bacterium 24-53-125]HQS58362.1 hypothetical protein [Gallionellaceae bacterium]HQS73917.1 hypothetical protein [Gallionellaceae bacterium]